MDFRFGALYCYTTKPLKEYERKCVAMESPMPICGGQLVMDKLQGLVSLEDFPPFWVIFPFGKHHKLCSTIKGT